MRASPCCSMTASWSAGRRGMRTSEHCCRRCGASRRAGLSLTIWTRSASALGPGVHGLRLRAGRLQGIATEPNPVCPGVELAALASRGGRSVFVATMRGWVKSIRRLQRKRHRGHGCAGRCARRPRSSHCRLKVRVRSARRSGLRCRPACAAPCPPQRAKLAAVPRAADVPALRQFGTSRATSSHGSGGHALCSRQGRTDHD